ncbi:type IV secretion protein Rhs [Burkholderia sp. JP2-270]|uniref:RHS repeat-associated core domain-containing protein n=1 Tax=Burkholderia sp. JP2-270 TaxID=2217913 RepID=UPI000DA2C1D6|nr:RHS repeat-associated core domain-containing protein [Burkholderia sp. JP2-270]AWV01456.1 type IV secretion protein Rhs [Burkholderia sp. JP2-270]
MGLLAVKHLDPVVGIDVHSVLVAPSPTPVFLPHPHVGFMLDLREYVEAAKGVVGSIAMAIVQEKVSEYLEDHPDIVKKLDDAAAFTSGKLADIQDNSIIEEGLKLEQQAAALQSSIGSVLGAGVGMGGAAGRPIFVNGLMRATVGTHSYHVPGLHFPLGESFAPPPAPDPIPSDDAESYMGSRTVLANNDPMSFMALPALSCWSIGMEPPGHNSAHTERTYPSMPSSVMLPIPAGRPVMVGGPPVMNMAAAAKGLFNAFQGSKWAKALADKLNLKPGFLRCKVLHAEPVDAITGEVIVQQHDFTVAGRLPLVWDRYYASRDTRRGAIGGGWQTPADVRLELMRHGSTVGAIAYFPSHATAFDTMPSVVGWAARVYDWQHGYALYRRDEQLILRMRAGIEYEFALPAHWQSSAARLVDSATLILRLHRMTDLNGNGWVFERGLNGNLMRLIEWKGETATGRAIACEASADHASLLTALMLIDADGRSYPLVGYEHDSDGNLIAVSNAMSRLHRFSYTDCHRMVRHSSARGVSFYYSHRQHEDGAWRVDHAWGDHGLFDYHFIYDAGLRETRILNSLGHTTILQANERGMPITRIDPSGGVTSYRYDGYGRTSTETDPAGRATTWEYDAYGNLRGQTLLDGSVIRTDYGADHKPICIAAPGDRRWRYVWDERGNLLEQTAPTEASMRYEYDQHGQLIAHTGPRGAVTRFDYDLNGNLSGVRDALGRRTRYAYDARANIVQTVDALGQVSCYEYDRDGNLTRSIKPGARETFCFYDADGNLIRYRDPIGQVTRFEYSPLGQVTKRLTPDGGLIEYRYDTEAQLVGVVNERGELYQLKRDSLGRIIAEIDYWGQQRRYEYGVMNELLRCIDPLGQVIDYEMDRLGRIVQKRVPDPQQPDGVRTEKFSYDSNGNLILAENPDSRIELKYDSAGRVIEEKQGAHFAIVSTYDAAGNRIARQSRLNSGGEIVKHTVLYEYDAVNAIKSIQIDDEAIPIIFERDALGQICVEHLGADLRRELSYSSEGLMARQSLLSGTGPLFFSEYTYNVVGEMTGKLDSRLGAEGYRYDPMCKLIEHLDPTGKLHRFLYDPAGDLLKTRIRRGFQTGVLDDQDPRTDAWIREGEHGDGYYAFDRAGNLVRRRTPQQDLMLRWDGDGLLIETLTLRQVPTTADGSGGTQRICTQYGYDVFHRRTKKITKIQDDVGFRRGLASNPPRSVRTSCYFWDDDVLVGEVAHEWCPDGNTAPWSTFEAHEWVYYPGTFRPLIGLQYLNVQQAPQTDNEGRPQAVPLPLRSTKEMRLFFHIGPNGAPTRLTDRSGQIVWESSYSALGNLIPVDEREIHYQPLRLQGQHWDFETGLHYNRHRYYDESLGSFISPDPVGLTGGINPYKYATNSLSWCDPLGLINVNVNWAHILSGSWATTPEGDRYLDGGHFWPAVSANLPNEVRDLDAQSNNNSGSYNAKIQIRGAGNTWIDNPIRNRIDFYPANWTEAQLKNEVEQALQNLKSGGQFNIKTPSGLWIMGGAFIVNQSGFEYAQVNTAFPCRM